MFLLASGDITEKISILGEKIGRKRGMNSARARLGFRENRAEISVGARLL